MKMLFALTVLALSSQLCAKSVSCDVRIYVADKGGYLMPGPSKTIITNISSSYNSDECSQEKVSSFEVSLCASEENFVGGHVVMAKVPDHRNNPLASSLRLYGTAKDKDVLLLINEEDFLFKSFLDNMAEGGIETPKSYVSDSLLIDDAIKEGMKAQRLKGGEPVILSISGCDFV